MTIFATPDSFVTSLGTVAFRTLLQGFNQSREAAVSERHVSGANENVIQVSGRTVTHVDCTLGVVSDADKDLLTKTLPGQQGTLTITEVYPGGVVAVLKSVKTSQWLRGGAWLVSVQFATTED